MKNHMDEKAEKIKDRIIKGLVFLTNNPKDATAQKMVERLKKEYVGVYNGTPFWETENVERLIKTIIETTNKEVSIDFDRPCEKTFYYLNKNLDFLGVDDPPRCHKIKPIIDGDLKWVRNGNRHTVINYAQIKFEPYTMQQIKMYFIRLYQVFKKYKKPNTMKRVLILEDLIKEHCENGAKVIENLRLGANAIFGMK